MPERAIRFTVQNLAGQCAASWKCLSPPGKEDVYLACRELRGALKASLHRTGEWHIAYFEGFFAESVPEEYRTEQGRYMWSRPTPMAPGVTLAFRIVTPWSSVTSQAHEAASIVCVPAPAEGKAVEFLLVLVDGPIPVSDWPGKNTGTQVVGSYALPSGTTVWIIWREIDMPNLPPLRGIPKFFRGKNLDDLKHGVVGMLLFGTGPDGSRIIYDCVAQYKSEEAGPPCGRAGADG